MRALTSGTRRRGAAGALAAVALLMVPIRSLLPQSTTGSQEGGLLSRPARLEVRGVTLDAALVELGQRSGVPIALSPGLLAGRSTVSCRCGSATVREALDSLLEGTGFEYLASPSRVIVTPARRAEPVRPAPAARVRAAARPEPRSPSGVLVVEVSAEADEQPIPGAEVRVSGRVGGWRTDAAGLARLVVAPGSYEVAVRALGFAPLSVPDVSVSDGQTRQLPVRLASAPIALSEVVVTPGTYGLIAEERAPSVVALSREEVETAPHTGEDIYRAVNRLPGVASADIGARLEVRGAPNDQILVLLDGLELHEPFHLKDVEGGIFSIVDVETVADVGLVTGGFGAEHGDRLGGVFAMRTTTPTRTVTTLGVSLQNVSLRSQGVFAGGRGAWLASARRGFLDLVLDLVNEDEPISPTYYDAFAKVQYQLGQRHLLSGHLLCAGDDLEAEEDDGTRILSRWRDGYAWLGWDAGFGRAVSARAVLSAGSVTRRRIGTDWQNPTTRVLDVDDRATYEFVGLTHDWSLEASDHWLVKWGYEVRSGRASYEYSRWQRWLEPNLTDPAGPDFRWIESVLDLTPKPSGTEVAAYLASRVRPAEALTVEAGLRFDHHSHPGDRTLSPRLNVAWEVGPGTTLRSAWGLYYQAQGLDALPVADLDTLFQPAQRAEHRIIGLERRIARGTAVRLEAYERLVRQPWREHRNLQPIVELVPEEGPWDRATVEPTRSRARGVELLVRKEAGGPLAWTASYALAASEDELSGEWVSRPREQRHTVRLEVAWRPDRRWSLTAAWQYHSPWPTTEYTVQYDTTVTGAGYFHFVSGPMNGGHLAPYHRLDARVTRHFAVGRGRLSLYLDAFNVYNRRNSFAYVQEIEGVDGNRAITRRDARDFVGLLPTIGARWEF